MVHLNEKNNILIIIFESKGTLNLPISVNFEMILLYYLDSKFTSILIKISILFSFDAVFSQIISVLLILFKP